MKSKILTVVRILFGLLLVVFGANKFLHFMPMPDLPDDAGALMEAFAASGYILQVVGLIELAVGVLLLINLFAPLAVVLLVPVTVNILLFHLSLDPAGIGPAVAFGVLNAVLLFFYLPVYLSMLTVRPKSGNS